MFRCKHCALLVAGTIFALVALAHLSRLFLQFPIIIDATFIPLWVNAVGFVISVLLSFWMFYTLKK